MISKLKYSKEDLEQFKSEYNIHKCVNGHPNIVDLYESCDDRWNVFLVMELCEQELMSAIYEKKRFSEKSASDLFRQMCAAVKHCHDRNVVHRDLKPENFMLTKLGDVKLTDFGLAVTMLDPEDILTEPCGSVYYIAPEVLKGEYSKGCDVWSLGIVLYLLLSGTVPFGIRCSDDDEIFRQIKSAPIEFHPRISPEAQELVMGLLERDPELRYTIEQALAHPWVTGESARDIAFDRKVVQSMMAFDVRNRFKREAMKLISSSLSAEAVQKLRTVFCRIDEDKTGTIELKEMVLAVKELNLPADTDFLELMKRMDSDGDGVVDYNEFLEAVCERRLIYHQQNIWNAFCVYDEDESGFISVDELQKVMKDEPREKVEAYLAEYDENEDGEISYEEFIRMVLPQDLKLKICRY